MSSMILRPVVLKCTLQVTAFGTNLKRLDTQLPTKLTDHSLIDTNKMIAYNVLVQHWHVLQK